MTTAPAPSDEYAINLAQSELRDGLNSGEIERSASVLSGFLVWMRDGEPSYWGREGHRAALLWIERMRQAQATLAIVPDNCRILGDFAFCRGWEKISSPGQETQRFRYFQTWERTAEGWKLTALMSNKDIEPHMLPD